MNRLTTVMFAAWVVVLATGATTTGQDSKAEWTVLEGAHVLASSGSPIETLEDGSHLVTAHTPDWDVYTIEAHAPFEVTGLRVEAIPHDSLPAGGPGRHEKGFFILSGTHLFVSPPRRPKLEREMALPRVAASAHHGGRRAYNAHDRMQNSGWEVRDRSRDHAIWFTTAEPVAKGAKMRIELRFECGHRQSLGCFRVSVTGDENPLRGADDPLTRNWGDVQKRVNTAIDRGVQALLDVQELDGSWREHQGSYPTGMTSLVVYTLLKSGVSKGHPAIKRGLAFMDAHSPQKTYETACQIMARAFLKDRSQRKKIAALAERLVIWQKSRGGWGYPGGEIDLSNTQYAALGLHFAAQNGFRVPAKVWNSMIDDTLEHQEKIGGRRGRRSGAYTPVGFSYRPNGKATGSMTSAGVGVLAICELNMKRRRADATVAKNEGIAWLVKHFSVTSNPSPKDSKPRAPGSKGSHIFYYLYGLERVAGLLDMKKMGPYDWYRMGALHLVDHQNGEGFFDRTNQTSTCFALLFLNKATGNTTGSRSANIAQKVFGKKDPGADVSLVASGQKPMILWVADFGTRVRKQYAWKEDEGKGPRVARVEYLARAPGQKEFRTIGDVAGNPKAPCGKNRFGIRHTFPGRGDYTVMARVHVVTPVDAFTERSDTTILESKHVQVKIRELAGPDLLTYAGDAGRNVLLDAKKKITGSSQHGNGWAVVRAFDGLTSQGWLSKDDDRNPWVQVELEEPVKADSIHFLHAVDNLNPDHTRTARVDEVRVIVNRKKKLTFEFKLEPDDEKKTRCPFPKILSIEHLRIEVLSVRDATNAKKGVGFNEVELQNSKPKRKRRR